MCSTTPTRRQKVAKSSMKIAPTNKSSKDTMYFVISCIQIIELHPWDIMRLYKYHCGFSTRIVLLADQPYDSQFELYDFVFAILWTHFFLSLRFLFFSLFPIALINLIGFKNLFLRRFLHFV